MVKFRQLRDRTDRALRSAAARRAGEGTYTAIRRTVLELRPRTSADAETAILGALAKRPSWTRVAEREFECSFGNRKVRIEVVKPFEPVAFFRRITRVEVEVFLGDSEAEMLRDLHVLAQRELQRLIDLDGGE
jgi:hypothetical protein